MLGYVSDLYSGYVASHHFNMYGSTLIHLPLPKLVVFYNGEKGTEDEITLFLNASFEEMHRNEADVEVRVRMININLGHNRPLLDQCKPLEEYSWLVNEIRTTKKSYSGLNMPEVINRALDSMPKDYEIRQFLIKHRAEVVGMLDREYNEENIRELFMEDGRREERANTERERTRAETAEARIKELEAELAKVNKANSDQ